jgi:hypothetical protein
MNKISPLLTSLLPRLDTAIFIILFLGTMMLGPRMLNIDGDLGRHITVGNYIRSNLKIPVRDVFSHTMAGEPVIPHEWLAQLVFSLANVLGGLNGIVLLTAIVIAFTFTLVYLEMRRQNVYRILALFFTLLAAYASSLHWLTRPHIFTFLFTALWAYLLEDERSKSWLFPMIMLVWANTHGAFIAGFVILGGHIAGWLWEYLHERAALERGKQLALIGGLSFAVTLINPAGWRLWGTSVGYLGNQYLVDHTVEYQSPNFHEPGTWPFLLLMVLGILALGFGGRMRAHQAILFAAWTAMSLYSARNIPLFAIVTTPYIGIATQVVFEKSLFYQKLENRIANIESMLKGSLLPSIAVILLVSIFPPLPGTANQFDTSVFPVSAVNWLQTHPQKGKMFNHFVWGGYLLYRMWPEKTVFIDGQTDFYGESLTRQYAQVINLEKGWKDILRKYDVSWAIIPPNQPLANALRDEMKWIVVYQDNTAVILHEP